MRRAVFRIHFHDDLWAVSFLKVRVTFWSLNQTIKSREGYAVLRCTRLAKFLANKTASPRYMPRYAVTFLRNGSLEQSTIGSTKWTRRHGARPCIRVGKKFLIEVYSCPCGGNESQNKYFGLTRKFVHLANNF